jgi:hypothetical protein
LRQGCVVKMHQRPRKETLRVHLLIKGTAGRRQLHDQSAPAAVTLSNGDGMVRIFRRRLETWTRNTSQGHWIWVIAGKIFQR